MFKQKYFGVGIQIIPDFMENRHPYSVKIACINGRQFGELAQKLDQINGTAK